MRATFLIGTLMLMAACTEQPMQQDPAPRGVSSGAGASYALPKADPCNRSDYAYGAGGDADYANCVIQN